MGNLHFFVLRICSSPEFPLYAHTLSLEIAALAINKLRSYISVKLTSNLKIVFRPRKIYVFILQCHIQILDKKNNNICRVQYHLYMMGHQHAV